MRLLLSRAITNHLPSSKPYFSFAFSVLGKMRYGQTSSPGSSDSFSSEEELSFHTALDTKGCSTINKEELPLSGSKKEKRRRSNSRIQDAVAEEVSSRRCTARGPSNYQDESSLPTSFGKKRTPSSHSRRQRVQVDNEEKPIEARNTSNSNKDNEVKPFDICDRKSRVSAAVQPSLFGKMCTPSSHSRRKRVQVDNEEKPIEARNTSNSNEDNEVKPFDICNRKSRVSAAVQPSLFADSTEIYNHEAVDELESGEESCDSDFYSKMEILRPGMVLLRSYLTYTEQIGTVKECRELGMRPEGFHQPIYQDGRKMRLQMMCLGLHWDHQRRKYYECRSADGARLPGIPKNFRLIVERAIDDAHAFIQTMEAVHSRDVEDILPKLSPDICIANFYTSTGRLGLHQDRDESHQSLRKGLPVVSISLGDSAVFVYGDERDMEKVKKVVLRSGDVLIFGGESRHIFHGVTSITPDSCPMFLREKAGIRPGRLNLTFRKY